MPFKRTCVANKHGVKRKCTRGEISSEMSNQYFLTYIKHLVALFGKAVSGSSISYLNFHLTSCSFTRHCRIKKWLFIENRTFIGQTCCKAWLFHNPMQQTAPAQSGKWWKRFVWKLSIAFRRDAIQLVAARLSTVLRDANRRKNIVDCCRVVDLKDSFILLGPLWWDEQGEANIFRER